METEISITITVERFPDSSEFLAYSDDVQCMATGNTADDAVMNFRDTLHDLITHYGMEFMKDLARKTSMTVSLD